MSSPEISEAITAQLAAALDTADADTVREIARLLLEEVTYLGEHMPEERESVAPFACSGATYHYCSFSTHHAPGCRAAGGDGELPSPASSCEPDCGTTDAEPWCHCSGFDCATCDIVDKLLGILARLSPEQAAS